jgi:hypothetical protein
MTFPVVGSNIPSAYQISNSLRFNDGDSPTLSRTPGSAGNRKTWTFSYWIKRSTISTVQQTFAVGTNAATPWFLNYINSDDTLHVWFHNGSSSYFSTSNNKLRDTSAWYHIVYFVDTTQATASDRFKVYVNNVEVSWSSYNAPAQNFDTEVNTTSTHYIGRAGNGQYFDGYIAETHFIDGQALTPSNFGESDLDSGVWKPKQYAGTYGTNGFYLKFNNTGNMGEDSSGNDNTWTPTNLSGTTDVTTDTPTNNFATLNSVSEFNDSTFSEGNLKYTGAAAAVHPAIGTIGVTSGKWYFEGIRLTGNSAYPFIGAYKVDGTAGMGGYLADTIDGWCMLLDGTDNGEWRNDTTLSGTSAGTFVNGDIANIAIDMDNGKIWFGRNGTWANSGNPSAGTGEQYSNLSGTIVPAISVYTGASIALNFGQDGSFAGNKTAQGNSDANGQGDFYYSVPTGFLALNSSNLATALSPTINDASYYFDTALHTGNNGSGRTFTGLNFQPDLIWGKVRDSSNYTPFSVDSSRGGTNFLTISSTASEDPGSHGKVNSFNSDGTTWIDGTNGTYPRLYYNDGSGSTLGGSTYVFWQWKANGGTTSSNTDGSITSTVQANTTAGFSIVTYTGDGSSSSTVGHGLGQTPDMIIIKRRNSTYGWNVWHQKLTTNYNMYLNDTSGEFSPTSKVHGGIGTPSSTIMNWISGSSTINNVNENGGTYVSYCFAEIEGYSKFGSYTGNGSTDGTFVYTGFRPAFVIVKRTNSTGYWLMFDSARQPENENDSWLLANDSSNEGINSTGMDFISNGFKLRNSSTAAVHNNISGSTYIYMAFAENPFVTSGNVPVTAR